MAVTPYNLVQGPAQLYYGAFGTAEPTDASATVVAGPPGAGWTDVGGTEIGVSTNIDVTYVDLTVSQLLDPVGARATARMITVTTQLAEATVANLSLVMNQLTTSTVSASYTTLDPVTTTSATQPTYAALIVDGWGPTLASGAAARRRWVIRKVICKPKITELYDLEKQALYDVTFQAYWVSAGVPLFHLVGQTA